MKFRQFFIKIRSKNDEIASKLQNVHEFCEIFENLQETFHKLCWNSKIRAVQRNAHLVDLEKCWKMNIYLQRSASIQPRTGLRKYKYKVSKILLLLTASPVIYYPATIFSPDISPADYHSCGCLQTNSREKKTEDNEKDKRNDEKWEEIFFCKKRKQNKTGLLVQ